MSRIRADQLVNRAGSGGPKFPHGVAEGFSVSGVVTATSFAGNVTGNADTATNSQGLTGTPNITVGTIGCGNVTSTGDVTGVNATFSGNLTVQGTTTTIDTAVTSVDSLAVDGRITGAGITVSGVGDLAVSQSTQGQSATLFLGKGGSSKVFSVDESGNLKIGSNLDSASTTNITLGTTGTAEFDGKVDVNNELHVHRASTTASNALLALHSDIGGTKTRKSTIRADGSAEFSGSVRVDHSGNAGSDQLARLGNVNNSGSNSAHLFLANGYYVSPTDVDGTGAAAKILADGTIHDSKGPLRDIPMNDQSSNASYTLIISDAGKLVHASGTTSTVVVPNGVFGAGNAVTILNGDGSNTLTISQGSGFSLRNTADSSTGNRTLAVFGMATIYFTGSGVGYISGAGLS